MHKYICNWTLRSLIYLFSLLAFLALPCQHTVSRCDMSVVTGNYILYRKSSRYAFILVSSRRFRANNFVPFIVKGIQPETTKKTHFVLTIVAEHPI